MGILGLLCLLFDGPMGVTLVCRGFPEVMLCGLLVGVWMDCVLLIFVCMCVCFVALFSGLCIVVFDRSL